MLVIPVIYEDEDYLVIDKPAGLSVHGDGFSEAGTLVDWLIEKYPEISAVGESMFTQKGKEIKKSGIVHRLDKETSGAMLVAKNQDSFIWLKQQFQDHRVKKIYRAILSGKVNLAEEETKVLTWPIGRSKNDPRKRVASLKADSRLREAKTTFRLLENLNKNYAYVEAEPETGRTHQLRVHFKAYQHPIIGDSLYNPQDDGGGSIARTALHAYELTFNNQKDETLSFNVPLAPDFVLALEKLRASC